MTLTTKQIKQRHFDKVYAAAPLVECKCGCRNKIKSKDKYARDVEYVNGHNGRKYNDPHQYKLEYLRRHKDTLREKKKQQRRERKIYLIKYKGGKCHDCLVLFNGENAAVFDFHHLGDKSFEISGRVLDYSLKNLEKEADKCDLLCSNCHRMRHFDE